MATQAAQLLAKGPLSSALGQWVFLGLGTFVVFTGDNGVSKAAQEIASVAFKLVTGKDVSAAALLREAALGSSAASASSLHQAPQQQPQQPIVIHSHAAPSGKSGGWVMTIFQVGVGAGACWGAYLIFSNYLPDQIKEMLPVTRMFFQKSVTALGNGIIQVRDALSKQIAVISGKQDELANKQDETHDQVLGIKDDIGDVRLQIDDIAVAISRCEGSLTDAAGRQTYMSRGVRLLVQCVGDLLRPSNPTVAEELDQFSRLSAELMDDEFYYRDGRKRNRIEECPGSPNLSEIGSTTSTSADDHNHHHMRALSLPRPRRSQSSVTPSGGAPSSTSKVMSMNRGHLMGMSPPPVKMLHSFGSNGTAPTAASSVSSGNSKTFGRSYSSPIEEVPHSNYHDMSSGHATPQSDFTDPVRLEEVDELLRMVKSGGQGVKAI